MSRHRCRGCLGHRGCSALPQDSRRRRRNTVDRRHLLTEWARSGGKLMVLASLKRLLVFLSNLVAGASRLYTVATWGANDTLLKNAHRIASTAVNVRGSHRSMESMVSRLDSASMKIWRTSLETASHDALKTLTSPEAEKGHGCSWLMRHSEINIYDKTTNHDYLKRT